MKGRETGQLIGRGRRLRNGKAPSQNRKKVRNKGEGREIAGRNGVYNDLEGRLKKSSFSARELVA